MEMDVLHSGRAGNIYDYRLYGPYEFTTLKKYYHYRMNVSSSVSDTNEYFNTGFREFNMFKDERY